MGSTSPAAVFPAAATRTARTARSRLTPVWARREKAQPPFGRAGTGKFPGRMVFVRDPDSRRRTERGGPARTRPANAVNSSRTGNGIRGKCGRNTVASGVLSDSGLQSFEMLSSGPADGNGAYLSWAAPRRQSPTNRGVLCPLASNGAWSAVACFCCARSARPCPRGCSPWHWLSPPERWWCARSVRGAFSANPNCGTNCSPPPRPDCWGYSSAGSCTRAGWWRPRPVC